MGNFSRNFDSNDVPGIVHQHYRYAQFDNLMPLNGQARGFAVDDRNLADGFSFRRQTWPIVPIANRMEHAFVAMVIVIGAGLVRLLVQLVHFCLVSRGRPKGFSPLPTDLGQ